MLGPSSMAPSSPPTVPATLEPRTARANSRSGPGSAAWLRHNSLSPGAAGTTRQHGRPGSRYRSLLRQRNTKFADKILKIKQIRVILSCELLNSLILRYNGSRHKVHHFCLSNAIYLL